MIEATAWAMQGRTKTGEKCVFRIQLSFKDRRSIKRLDRLMKKDEWLDVGSSYHPVRKMETLIYQKDFNDRDGFVNWATKQKGLKITELNRKGAKKAVYGPEK